ncbi:MAG: class I SAM-dependent methyltransferase [Elusimicrobia bacterium]|nr:class I SAM-dependent methyltransferase [Elusimicrobiota bacterium]
MKLLKKRFANIDLNHPTTTILHAQIIKTNPFLKHWYSKQYAKYKAFIADNKNGLHIEIGAGGGFLKKTIPFVKTSSILKSDKERGLVDLILNAETLDLEDNSIDSFFLLDVFHHLKNPKKFLFEANRCLKKNGIILMIEPANTIFSRIIYKKFHHELFDETASDWLNNAKGHLSASNQALGYIVFERDKNIFKNNFPNLEILRIRKHTFLQYILSGGLSYEPLLSESFIEIKNKGIDCFEAIILPFINLLATYMDICIRKKT